MVRTLGELCESYLLDYHGDTTPKTRYSMEVFCRQLLQDFGDITLGCVVN
jgi:hypothetical protein